MNVPLWVTELAANFWSAAGDGEAFPRTLREPLMRTAFELTLEDLPDLSIAGVERYLARRGCNLCCAAADRLLRGCLVARREGAYIFLDAHDDPRERAFSLAHELAHFLRDYWQPRQRAVSAFGLAILDVLDGRRPARPEERLHSLLRQAPIHGHVHLMDRQPGMLLPAVDEAERDADRLALELLAPAAEIHSHLQGKSNAEREVLLCQGFGLPAAIAREYAGILFPPAEPLPLLDRLKKALAARRNSPDAREVDEGESRDEQRP